MFEVSVIHDIHQMLLKNSPKARIKANIQEKQLD